MHLPCSKYRSPPPTIVFRVKLEVDQCDSDTCCNHQHHHVYNTENTPQRIVISSPQRREYIIQLHGYGAAFIKQWFKILHCGVNNLLVKLGDRCFPKPFFTNIFILLDIKTKWFCVCDSKSPFLVLKEETIGCKLSGPHYCNPLVKTWGHNMKRFIISVLYKFLTIHQYQ